MKGWVYIITNKAMPNLVKVGYSTKDPELRAEELHTTGVPHRFVVEYDVLVHEPRDIEQVAHNLLKNYHANKEWFNCSVETAIMEIRRAAAGKILLENNRFNRKSSEKKWSLYGEYGEKCAKKECSSYGEKDGKKEWSLYPW